MPNLTEDMRASALRRLNTVGIDNLVDDSIQPRQHLGETGRRSRIKLSEPDTPVISMDEYDELLIQSLDALVQVANDYEQVRQDLLAEVRSRHLYKGNHPYKNVREILASDVRRVLKTYQSPEVQSKDTRKKRKRPANAASSSRQLRPRDQSSSSEERPGQDDADLNDVNTKEATDAQDESNKPDGDHTRHAHGRMQNEPGELMRVTVFYPIRDTVHAQDDDTSISLDDILDLANSADYLSHRTASNTRVNMKVLPIQSTDDDAADAAYEKADKITRSLIHLRSFVPMAEEIMQVPTRKSPEVHLMAAVSEAWDTARQAMHEAASLNEEYNDAELDRAREAHAQYERAEFEWRRNMMARLAQMQLNNANATSGLVLSPKLKELFEPVLL